MKKDNSEYQSKCLKCQPSALTQARSCPRHWSVASSLACCCRLDHAAIRHCFRSATLTRLSTCRRIAPAVQRGPEWHTVISMLCWYAVLLVLQGVVLTCTKLSVVGCKYSFCCKFLQVCFCQKLVESGNI